MLIKAFEHADDEQRRQLNMWVDAVSFAGRKIGGCHRII